MSTKCWGFVPRDMVRAGNSVEVPTLQKPADPKRKKVKNFNRGAPDLKLRFEAI